MSILTSSDDIEILVEDELDMSEIEKIENFFANVLFSMLGMENISGRSSFSG